MAELMKPTLEQCKEAMKNASGSVSTAIATLMLACQLQVAQAQTTPVSLSTFASATADKGGGQIVSIDGIQYTFAKIAGMNSSERKSLQILKKLGEIGKLREYQEWSSVELEAANQRIEEKKGAEQLANQNNQEKLKIEQTANQKFEAELVRMEGNIKILLEKGKKLDIKTRGFLVEAVSYGKPPDTIDYFKKVLANAQNFA